jgi:hypothetical protein
MTPCDALRGATVQRRTDGISRVQLAGEPSFRLPASACAETLMQWFRLGTRWTSAPAGLRLTDRFERDERNVGRLSRRTTTVLAGRV